MRPRALTNRSTLWVVAFLAVACGQAGPDPRVARHAAAVLGVPPSTLRVTTESELQGERHDFYFVVADSGPSLMVVVPRDGEPFDGRTPDAFDRVARGEQAATRLSQLGAERVAAWFGALGGGRCAPPPVDQAHFAAVSRHPGGDVELSYRVGSGHGLGVQLTCVIALAPDGTLRSARTLESSAQRATAAWRSGAE